MIVYSVTVSIDKNIESDWLQWMRGTHIPDVMDTGCFLESHLQRLLDPPPEMPGAETYNVQYLCRSRVELEVYQKNFAPALQAEHTERYKDRFVAFRTILERL